MAEPTAIIGVLPQGFRFPAGERQFLAAARDRSRQQHRAARPTCASMGRLADGVTIDTGRSADECGRRSISRSNFPTRIPGTRIELMPAAAVAHPQRAPHRPVLGLCRHRDLPAGLHQHRQPAASCASRGRQSELSVRTALGASASRFVAPAPDRAPGPGRLRGCRGRRRRTRSAALLALGESDADRINSQRATFGPAHDALSRSG